ncbi:MAG: hypothetical protein KA311_04920 [Sediminibacterium sp.]|nr:hypothetical protein [Sediminibacterium sp.]MBP7939541.1 hypothetical protein [Sediminibacterium sp.]
MAQDKITEIFDIQAIEANIAKAISAAKSALPELEKLGQNIKANTTIGGSSNNTAAANAAMAEFTKNLKDYTEAVKAAAAARFQLSKISDEEAAKQKVNSTALNAQLKEEIKLTSNLTGAYEKLNIQHKQAIKAYQDAAAAGKVSAQQLVVLKDNANKLGEQLVKIDAGVGNFRRNVGNYSSAWNGLGMSIQQVAREMPNFAQSMQLGFLAISNNLPILADELKRAKDNIKALKDEGKDAPSLFSQIASSVFSWQTLLTIGITLLVKYGAEIADWAMQVSDAEKVTRKYREALDESIKGESEGISKLYILKAALNDTTNARSNDLAAFNEVKKQYPEYFNYLNTEKESLIELNNLIDAQIKARVENAKQTALNKVAADATNEYVKAQMDLNKEIGLWEKNTSFAIGGSKNLTAETKRLYQAYEILFEEGKIGFKEWLVYQNRIENISNAEKQATISTNALTKSLLKLKDAVNSASEDELIELENNVIKYKEGTKQRLRAEEVFINQKKDIKIKELQQEFNGDALSLAGNKRFQQEKLNIELKAQREIESLRKSYDKKNQPKPKPEDKTADIILQQMNDVALNEQINIDKRLTAIRKELDQGLLSITEYQNKKKIIVKEGEDSILKLQIQALDDYLIKIGLNAQGRAKVQETITTKHKEEIKRRQAADEEESLQRAEARKLDFEEDTKTANRIFDELLKDYDRKDKKRKDDADKEKQIQEEKYKYIQQIAQETSTLIFTLLDAQTQKEISAAEKRSEALTAEYDLQRKAVEEANISAEEKTARKLVLDAEEAESQKKIDNEIRDLKIKQAKFDKAQALTTIAINAAMALASAKNLGTLGALSPFIIGLAAAQAAVVLATPLPEYAKGKKASDSYEGLAIAGEKGTEMKIDKDGSLQLLTKPTLIHTKRGDTILSNKELMSGELGKHIKTSKEKANYDELIKAYSYHTDRTIKAIKNSPSNIIIDNSNYNLSLKRARV